MKRAMWVLVLLAAFASVKASNLIPNPGFENWTNSTTPANWTYETGITVEQHSDTVYQGSYSAKVTLTTTDQTNTDMMSDFFSVIAGKNYQFVFHVFDNDYGGKVRLAVHWYDTNQNWIQSDWGDYSPTQQVWQQVSNTFTAPAGAAYAKFGYRFYDTAAGWDGDAVFYLDDMVADTVGSPVFVAEGEAPPGSGVTLRSTLVRDRLDIAFSLPRAGAVSVALYNAAGQRVQTLWQGTLSAGEHLRHIPVHLNTGIYFVTMSVDGRTVATRRVVVVR